MPFFRDLILQLNELLAQQSLTRKVIAGFTLLAVLGGLGYLIAEHGKNINQEVLFADLSDEQAKTVKEELQRTGQTFQMSQGERGYSFRVPENRVLALRLELASKVPKTTSGPGWGLFDPKDFGMTQSEFNVKKYRAQKGELERTIGSMQMVRSCHLELTVPEAELFVKDKKAPKASVMIELYPNMSIAPEQVRTIQLLVAGGVDGLTADNVVVADTFGKTLNVDTRDATIAEKSKLDNRERLIEQNEKLRKDTEQALEKKIVDALQPVFGSGGVRASVSVEYDHTSREEQATVYGPTPVPVSSADIEEFGNNGGKMASGVVGATRQVENVDSSSSTVKNASQFKKEKINNYNNSKTESKTVTGLYSIKRITAGVVVNDKPVYEAGKTDPTRRPLTKKEISELEDTVKGIINFREKRDNGAGDEVKVTNIAFIPPAKDMAENVLKEFEEKKKVRMYIQYGVFLVVFLSLLFFVVRPLLRVVTPKPVVIVPEATPAAALAETEKRLLATVGERPLALAGKPGEAIEGLMEGTAEEQMPADTQLKLLGAKLDDEILALTKGNPKKVGLILRSWVEGTL